MIIEEKQARNFLEIIAKFIEREQEVVKDFDNRFNTIYEHRRKIAEIARLSKLMRLEGDEKVKAKLDSKIDEVKKDIATKFKVIIEYELKEEEFERRLTDKEIKTILEEKNELVQDYSEIFNEGKEIKGKSVRTKLYEMLFEIEEALREEKKEITIDGYLNKLLDILNQIIIKQKKILEEEVEQLEKIKRVMVPEKNDEEKLLDIFSRLNNLQRKEKEEFIDPFNKFLKKKKSVNKKIKELLTKDKITISDVKKDLRKFTRTSEVTEYASSLNRLSRKNPKMFKNPTKFISFISNVRSKSRYKEKYIDPLTEIFNRGYFNKQIIEDVEEHNKTKKYLSLVFYDVDFFKNFNEEYGHLIGDEVLKYVINVMKNSKRSKDVLCRYGGEEFVLLLKKTDRERALFIAERIRKKVEDLSAKFISDKNKFREKKIEEKAITISGGVATFMGSGEEGDIEETSEILIKKADKALKKAKSEGRNTIKLHPEYITISH